jgi:sporadic carbohydrate cluster protein (TIGR04323 family)
MIERSVPQSIQQMVIRNYCEKNGLHFLLSATEWEGHTTMLDAIKEDGIVMYSIFCMPKGKAARERLYASGKDVHFAAENMKMNPELVETVFGVYNGRNQLPAIIAYLNQA